MWLVLLWVLGVVLSVELRGLRGGGDVVGLVIIGVEGLGSNVVESWVVKKESVWSEL